MGWNEKIYMEAQTGMGKFKEAYFTSPVVWEPSPENS